MFRYSLPTPERFPDTNPGREKGSQSVELKKNGSNYPGSDFLEEFLLICVNLIILRIVQEIEGIDLQVDQICKTKSLELLSFLIQPEDNDPVRHPL